eukprot:13622-Heterococcus_DN1.PRE.1
MPTCGASGVASPASALSSSAVLLGAIVALQSSEQSSSCRAAHGSWVTLALCILFAAGRQIHRDITGATRASVKPAHWLLFQGSGVLLQIWLTISDRLVCSSSSAKLPLVGVQLLLAAGLKLISAAAFDHCSSSSSSSSSSNITAYKRRCIEGLHFGASYSTVLAVWWGAVRAISEQQHLHSESVNLAMTMLAAALWPLLLLQAPSPANDRSSKLQSRFGYALSALFVSWFALAYSTLGTPDTAEHTVAPWHGSLQIASLLLTLPALLNTVIYAWCQIVHTRAVVWTCCCSIVPLLAGNTLYVRALGAAGAVGSGSLLMIDT